MLFCRGLSLTLLLLLSLSGLAPSPPFPSPLSSPPLVLLLLLCCPPMCLCMDAAFGPCPPHRWMYMGTSSVDIIRILKLHSFILAQDM